MANAGATAVGHAYLNRPVYLAFATGPLALSTEFLDRVAEANPDAALLVVSRVRPHRGEWIEIPAGQGTGAILAACRKAIAERSIAGAAVHATRQGGEWRMRIAALIAAGTALRIYNDHLDHFPLRNTRVLWRHLKWRWSQRRRGVIWWNVLAKAAIFCGGATIPGRHSRTMPVRRFSCTPLTPGISVVIPSRDGRGLLASMLPGVIADLQAHTGELIVVDNGSGDGTASFLREEYPQIHIDASVQPLSFSEAVNRGIESARYSHVVLLNNDMQIEPGFFAALRTPFDRTPDLFCTTAQIFFPPGERREETGLCFWHRDGGAEFPVYCAEPAPGEDGTQVLYGSGGCSMYDARKLRELGGFDECYRPAYVEDLDIGYRGWQRGWPTIYCGGAKVEHRHRATTSRYYKADYLDYLVERNYLRFLVRATGGIFPELWRDAVARLRDRAIAGDTAARRALRTAWREGLSRQNNPGNACDERARKALLTK